MKRLFLVLLIVACLLLMTEELQAECYYSSDFYVTRISGCEPGYTCRHQETLEKCSSFNSPPCWCFPDEQPLPPPLPPGPPIEPGPGFVPPYVLTPDSPPKYCSLDASHEIVPSCAVCPEEEKGDLVLFCWGNDFRNPGHPDCQTDPKIVSACQQTDPDGWWCAPSLFPSGTLLYNGITFTVPIGGVHVCGANHFGCSNPGCEGISFFRAPIGFLDQMNITAEKKINPCSGEEVWDWAACLSPSGEWVECEEAEKKLGFSSAGPLYYPLWLEQWRDYVVQTVLPRRLPYLYQDKTVRDYALTYSQNPENFPASGWVEFVTSGEVHEGKKTKITHPRAMLFNASYVGQLSYATNLIWQSFTGLYNQPKKPVLARNGRDPYSGDDSANDKAVDFGAYSPAPGFYAADKIKGSCADKDCGNSCGFGDYCPNYCCEVKDLNPFSPTFLQCIQWRQKDEEPWTMRQINPDIEGHDSIETLNPGWSELANSWNNIANPINGFIPAIARKYNLKTDMGDGCDNLFGSVEDLQAYSQAPDQSSRKSICSWRYAKTPFVYSYGGEAHQCAEIINPATADDSKEETQCYAHWPFVGGLEKVYQFILQFENLFQTESVSP